MEGRKWSKN